MNHKTEAPIQAREFTGNRLALLGTLVVFYGLLAGLDRLVLATWTPPELFRELPYAFVVGAGFDLVAIAWALLLPAALILVMPTQWMKSKLTLRLSQAALLLGLFLMLFNLLSGWVFWNEFQSRFNFIAVDYLVYTTEVIDNIVESYPLPLILTSLGFVSLMIFVPARRVFLHWSRRPNPRHARLVLVAFIVLPVASFAGLSGDGSRVSKNRVTNELAKDNLYSLFSAFRSNRLDFTEHFATLDLEEALAAVRAESKGQIDAPIPHVNAPLLRSYPATPVAGARNVILVMVESLDASFLGKYGGAANLTPNLNKLMDQSVVYDRFFATGSRTVRGLEAVTLSIPPTPGRSIVKRPDCEGLDSIGWPLQEAGYDTKFLYGGYGYFDNMNRFFSTNGFDVVDRSDLADDEVRFANAWGVCDQDILARTLVEADQSHKAGKPFFSFVMTTSNHRPYTYPDVVETPSGKSRAGAVQYTDHAIGEFLDKARSKPWFGNTIFVVVADHCSSSAGKRELNLAKHHIPLMLYAPSILPARADSRLASQVDLGPTLLSMLGVSYEAQHYGVDLQTHEPEQAFVGNYQTLGYFDGDYLTCLSTGRRVGAYEVLPSLELKEATVDPARQTLTTAYYQTASYLFDAGLLKIGDDGTLQARR